MDHAYVHRWELGLDHDLDLNLGNKELEQAFHKENHPELHSKKVLTIPPSRPQLSTQHVMDLKEQNKVATVWLGWRLSKQSP
jgi:hypothetical protein